MDSQGSSFSNSAPQTPTVDIQKVIQQAERKKEYNRQYYKEVTREQRQKEKTEIQGLREKYAQLEETCRQLNGEKTIYVQQIQQLISIIEEMKIKMNCLYEDNVQLNSRKEFLSTQNE